MKSKTLISKQLKRKTNSELAETVLLAKKNSSWLGVAGILSGPRKNRINLNLNEIEEKADNSKIILIPGKVLSQGEITKKMKVVALGFSERAREKLLKSGCEIKTILEEIKSNPNAKDVKVLR